MADVKIYIVEPEGSYTLLSPIQDLDVTYVNECDELPSIFTTSEASFEAICRASKETIMALCGIRESVIKCCPNKRVAHLAIHAKKARTRKKNFSRAIKILEV